MYAGQIPGPAYFALYLDSFMGESGDTGAPGLWGNASHINASRTVWVNSGLDGHGWKFGSSESIPARIYAAITQPLFLNPSAWNSEASLLPIRIVKERPSYKSSLILDCENARHFRIDNMAPGDILTLGSDKWKVFPWYRKNSSVPTSNMAPPTNYNHTACLGWAIRYEGP